MIRHLIFCLLATLGTSSFLFSQEFEIGILGGLAMYSGDLSPGEDIAIPGVYPEDFEPGGGVYIRYRPVNRLAFRATGFFGRLSATDEENGFGGTTIGIARNFRSNITDIGLTAEFDLLRIGPPRAHVALYLTGGASLLSFDPEGNLDGTWVKLQPLRTEGQGSGLDRYDPAPYSLNEFTVNFGGGIRVQLNDRISIGLETVGRRVGSDHLDDVSNTLVNYLDILENSGRLAARFSNPFIEDPATSERLDYRRGGRFADYWFSGSLTVGITLGKGAGGGNGKLGCYTF